MTHINKQDWLEEGLKTLGQVGLKGLTIDGLAAKVGVTKGSFYHHFKNVQDFREQLVTYWADQYLSTSINLPQAPAECLALLDAIMGEAFSPATEPEIAIRTWAQHNEHVRDCVEQVDATRHSILKHIFHAVTADESQAHLMADMLSMMLIGSLSTIPRTSPERVLELYREFKRLYGLD